LRLIRASCKLKRDNAENHKIAFVSVTTSRKRVCVCVRESRDFSTGFFWVVWSMIFMCTHFTSNYATWARAETEGSLCCLFSFFSSCHTGGVSLTRFENNNNGNIRSEALQMPLMDYNASLPLSISFSICFPVTGHPFIFSVCLSFDM